MSDINQSHPFAISLIPRAAERVNFTAAIIPYFLSHNMLCVIDAGNYASAAIKKFRPAGRS
jgi:hypothetical protein